MRFWGRSCSFLNIGVTTITLPGRTMYPAFTALADGTSRVTVMGISFLFRTTVTVTVDFDRAVHARIVHFHDHVAGLDPRFFRGGIPRHGFHQHAFLHAEELGQLLL